LLTDKPRHRKVLERAAEMIDWHQPAAPGVHRGIALHEAHGSIVAEGVEIGWEPERKIRIRRISCAIDCGLALNPDTIEAQMESGIVYGDRRTLGEINVTQGRVVQGNFNDCRALRLPEMPSIDVAITEGGDRPGGVGEPGTLPIAPASRAPFCAASGERIRHCRSRGTASRWRDKAESCQILFAFLSLLMRAPASDVRRCGNRCPAVRRRQTARLQFGQLRRGVDIGVVRAEQQLRPGMNAPSAAMAIVLVTLAVSKFRRRSSAMGPSGSRAARSGRALAHCDRRSARNGTVPPPCAKMRRMPRNRDRAPLYNRLPMVRVVSNGSSRKAG
jgi:hypothetical protein